MSRVDAIKKAIETLPDEDYVQLRKWFSEKDWRKWDKQIAADSRSGKLDFLVKEAVDGKSKGKLRGL
jgi:NAD-dependent DNA ligase